MSKIKDSGSIPKDILDTSIYYWPWPVPQQINIPIDYDELSPKPSLSSFLPVCLTEINVFQNFSGLKSYALFISFLPKLYFINSFLALSKVLANTFCILQEKNVQTIVEMGRCQYSFSPTDREQIDSAEESLGCFLGETTKKISPRAASQIDVLSMVACGGWEDRRDRWSIRFLWATARLKEERGRLVNFWKSLFPPWTWSGCWNSSNRLCKAFWILRRRHRSTASLLLVRL